MPSEQIFPFGAEGKGGTPPLPRRKREKTPEGIEYPMNKPIIQVVNAYTRFRVLNVPALDMRFVSHAGVSRFRLGNKA
ncbi:MAG TPA: hypothetical protein VLE95_03430 [Chlamydiales bacterium]|nr:hypothetical protein [Chlamydiales bacterium]